MTTLIKNKQQITCNNCNELTPYIVKKKKLFGEFERMYAECENCQYQKTIYYTNKKLRSLLKKQKNETHHPRKLILKEKIESEMRYLQDKLER